MLTKKGKYGLKALVHLARSEPGKAVQVAEIAARENISKKFLDAIMRDLKNAGFVRSWKGPGGGFALSRPPAEISIGPVVRALDGPLAPIACASRTAFQPCDDCGDLSTCSVRIVMTEVRDAMAEVLDRTTLADMLQKSNTAAMVLAG
ncbi:Rrf2 family transcriptional regulator [Pleomorphomonas diazotrophica]|uniref:Rrf2 family transcriptional regulator n=1 Tax=Pleomorphomonas diazotrophica TaxID=1166257 RepID=A0A1I4TZT3_9HYPH|nr:Rrf2 family transcriptional regulator [Pleomorphomonas diazotrophica]PKR87790.1 Rrf2 family transcriptional regulator [Pleomorphomonas diazotrophica]SFM81993.1 Rrf2 family protein [Pleomorphomonas diazotrophica]